MFTEIRIENFKSLKHIKIELRPLTIFIGPNASGKSSILQSVIILKKLFNAQGQVPLHGLFQLDGYINMGTWDDVTFQASKPIHIGITITKENIKMHLNTTIHKSGKNDLEVKLIVKDIENVLRKTITLPYSQKQVQDVRIRTERGVISARWDGFNISVTSTSIPSSLGSNIVSLMSKWQYKIFFIPTVFSMFREPQIFIKAQSSKDSILDSISKSLIVSESALMSLIAMDPNIEDYIIRCTKEIFGIEIRARPIPPNVWRIISSIRKGKTIPIVNEGGGVNRNVYMFTILALANEDSTVLIEEPETNLHPSAQYNLAKIFVEAVSEERKQLIITTHSEHLLLGILRYIAKKKLDLSDLMIYYTMKDEYGRTSLKPLEIDRHGRVKGGLPGFFEEEVKEILELLSI